MSEEKTAADRELTAPHPRVIRRHRWTVVALSVIVGSLGLMLGDSTRRIRSLRQDVRSQQEALTHAVALAEKAIEALDQLSSGIRSRREGEKAIEALDQLSSEVRSLREKVDSSP